MKNWYKLLKESYVDYSGNLPSRMVGYRGESMQMSGDDGQRTQQDEKQIWGHGKKNHSSKKRRQQIKDQPDYYTL